MKYRWILSLIAAVLLAVPARMLARQPFPEPGKGIMHQLKLTEEQEKQVQSIHTDIEKRMIAERAKMATARVDLRTLLRADNPDKSAITKKMSEIADIGVSMHSQRLDGWFAINKILTPDQQKVWKKALANAGQMNGKAAMMRMHRMNQRPGMRMGQGMQPGMGMRPDRGMPAPEPPSDK